MQQRQLRLGDILDDYCPRERRVTNHAVVAMVGRRREADALHDVRRRARIQARQGSAPAPESRHAGRALRAGRSRARPSVVTLARARGGEPPRTTTLQRCHAATTRRSHRRRRPTHRRPRRERGGADRRQRTLDEDDRDADDEDARRGRGRGPGPSAADSRVAAAARRAAAAGASDSRLHDPPAGGGRPNRFRPRHQRGGAASSFRAIARTAATWPRRPARGGGRGSGGGRATAASGAHAIASRRRRARTAGREAVEVRRPRMSDLSGKHGLIVGVANKRSISWAIAQAAARRARASR